MRLGQWCLCEANSSDCSSPLDASTRGLCQVRGVEHWPACHATRGCCGGLHRSWRQTLLRRPTWVGLVCPCSKMVDVLSPGPLFPNGGSPTVFPNGVPQRVPQRVAQQVSPTVPQQVPPTCAQMCPTELPRRLPQRLPQWLPQRLPQRFPQRPPQRQP